MHQIVTLATRVKSDIDCFLTIAASTVRVRAGRTSDGLATDGPALESETQDGYSRLPLVAPHARAPPSPTRSRRRATSSKVFE